MKSKRGWQGGAGNQESEGRAEAGAHQSDSPSSIIGSPFPPSSNSESRLFPHPQHTGAAHSKMHLSMPGVECSGEGMPGFFERLLSFGT